MKRRAFFELFAGLAVAVRTGVGVGRAAGVRIGVVGAGILGSSIAYHLARRGADVVVFEKERPAAGATSKSFAWINATFSKRPLEYYRLNRLGALGYRHLERMLGGALRVQWGGSVEWYGDEQRADVLGRQVAQHQAWGYPTRLVDEATLRRLEPNVEPGPVRAAAYTEEEGSVDPVAATEALVAAARAEGARFELGAEVGGLELDGGRLRGVATSRGRFELDVLVVAAGVDTPRIAAMAGLDVPLRDAPGILAHTRPAPRLVERVVLAPGAHMKQKLDGRIVTGVGFGGTPSTDTSREHGEKVLAAARRFLPRLVETELERVTLGYRPLPRDGHPVVGFPEAAPDVYLTVMHSGITLAPVIGRFASMEILDGVRVVPLEPFRLERFGAKS